MESGLIRGYLFFEGLGSRDGIRGFERGMRMFLGFFFLLGYGVVVFLNLGGVNIVMLVWKFN